MPAPGPSLGDTPEALCVVFFSVTRQRHECAPQDPSQLATPTLANPGAPGEANRPPRQRGCQGGLPSAGTPQHRALRGVGRAFARFRALATV